jgi:hypothetical protein
MCAEEIHAAGDYVMMMGIVVIGASTPGTVLMAMLPTIGCRQMHIVGSSRSHEAMMTQPMLSRELSCLGCSGGSLEGVGDNRGHSHCGGYARRTRTIDVINHLIEQPVVDVIA